MFLHALISMAAIGHRGLDKFLSQFRSRMRVLAIQLIVIWTIAYKFVLCRKSCSRHRLNVHSSSCDPDVVVVGSGTLTLEE